MGLAGPRWANSMCGTGNVDPNTFALGGLEEQEHEASPS